MSLIWCNFTFDKTASNKIFVQIYLECILLNSPGEFLSLVASTGDKEPFVLGKYKLSSKHFDFPRAPLFGLIKARPKKKKKSVYNNNQNVPPSLCYLTSFRKV